MLVELLRLIHLQWAGTVHEYSGVPFPACLSNLLGSLESVWDSRNRNYTAMAEQGQSWGRRRKACAVFWPCRGGQRHDGGSVLKQTVIEKVEILCEKMD